MDGRTGRGGNGADDIHLADLIGILWSEDNSFHKTIHDEAARRLVQEMVCTRGGVGNGAFARYAEDRAWDRDVDMRPAERDAVGPDRTDAHDPAVFAAVAGLHREGATAELLEKLRARYLDVVEARGLQSARAACGRGQEQQANTAKWHHDFLAMVDSILRDFLWLQNPPPLPDLKRDNDLWRRAIDKAWEEYREFAKRKDLAVMVGGGRYGTEEAGLKRGLKLRAATERKGEPSLIGLPERFHGTAEQAYRRLDPAYAQAEEEGRRKAAEETAAVRKRLDLHMVSIKSDLRRWSELAETTGWPQAWECYLAAAQYDRAAHAEWVRSGNHSAKHYPLECLRAVIQDLEGSKAKIEEQAAAHVPDAGAAGKTTGRRRGRKKLSPAQAADDSAEQARPRPIPRASPDESRCVPMSLVELCRRFMDDQDARSDKTKPILLQHGLRQEAEGKNKWTILLDGLDAVTRERMTRKTYP